MKYFYLFSLSFLTLFSTTLFAQKPEGKPEAKKLIVTGKVIEKTTSQPLEYATITLFNTKANKITSGGITDANGEFKVEANPGTYDIKIEFISFKIVELKAKTIADNTNLGVISLEDNSQQLNEVVVRNEKTTVEIKLDKKVYNVGKDLMVKGGTVSDVLDNIPSVAVDVEGNVSLRGNENVRVLIDGKPSNAISIADALKLIPADAIDKVEVITNPSARYDAEGGGGLLNIILKKGRTSGLNGTFLLTTGYPDNHGVNATINYKGDDFNFFTTQGYNYRSNPGNSYVETDYLSGNASSPASIIENRDNDRLNKAYNGSYGLDWNLDKSLNWTNVVNYRKSSGDNQDNVVFDNFYTNSALNNTRTRTSFEGSESENIEFNSTLAKKFKKDGHKLNLDFQVSSNQDLNIADIYDSTYGNDKTNNDQSQSRRLVQLDYVLPVGKDSQFEAGYRGDFTNQNTNVVVFEDGALNDNFTNQLEYKEKVNALYTQYGFKVKKFSFLFGARWEDSNIDVNQIKTRDFNNKKYDNFFPSAFVTYEIKEKTNVSFSYSKRINRPRGRQLNPFSNYSSNINIFQGNPDLNPALTDAFDIGFLKSWEKITLSTSAYFNHTEDVFQFVRRESGAFVNGIPVILSSPINLSTEDRAGFEFTLNYTPYKWWRLNSNFNFYSVVNKGNYTYVNFNNEEVTQNFDNKATTWTTRLTSKITLPGKIDWQTNMNYDGDQKMAQGKRIGVFAMNLAFSKDILKDKGTLAFNVSDVFNSRKRIMETLIPGSISSYAEMQWRERQFTLSFTYRFNKPKNEREKPKRPMQDNDGGGGDF
ncbi:TonB-dependent receptor domain-containing protein [Flavobacterium sp.]|uniref:TonB-dependent receptor domain-containing protein n=1 Tax=Flavobacterium sp. TaxID=239 RepID=UPI002B4B333C|nr:TonB-dependent receptor [Flavobacterium sp.]HLP63056.1 TonB-dependent receptor [Flavobacterium sp.]